MTRQPQNAVDYDLLLLLSAIFGVAFIMIAVALETLPVMTIVAVRLALAAMMFVMAATALGQKLAFPAKVWLLIMASGILGNALPFFLITSGRRGSMPGLRRYSSASCH